MKKLILLFFLFPACLLYAQNFDSTLYRASVEELIRLKVAEKETDISVGSFKATAIRETPAIVSLLTQEDIEASGARDLVDLLRLVQGINFAQNFDNVAGMGIRGNWSEEGKVLILIDEQILNETSFGTIMYGQRYPLANIERIEIIRGAGSAIYGGLAGLSVIHIISKSAKKQPSTNLFTQLGLSEGNFSRASFQGSSLQKLRNKVFLDLSAAYQTGNRSNRSTENFIGQQISFKDSSRIETFNINATLHHKNFEAGFIYNDYSFESLGFVAEDAQTIINSSRDLLMSTKYEFEIGKISFKPYFRFKYHRPWWYRDYQHLASHEIYDGYKMSNFRYNTGFIANIALKNALFNFGFDFYREDAIYEAKNYNFFNGSKYFTLYNKAAFAEITHNSLLFNLTVGLRVEKNNIYDWAFAPRLAFTKVIKNFHAKLLASYAFKAPTVQNIQYAKNNDIKPEFMRSLEAEIGWRFNTNFQLNANVFHVRIESPIVYIFEPVSKAQYYENLGETGTQGVELESHWKAKWGFLKANYSFYQPTYLGVPNYLIEQRKDMFLGLPAHKINLYGLFRHKNWAFSTNWIFFSQNATYGFFNAALTDYRLQNYPATYRADAHLSYQNFLLNGLKLSFHIYNFTDRTSWLINPVDNTNIATPEMGREFVIRLRYELNN